jgi:hypothetical protein
MKEFNESLWMLAALLLYAIGIMFLYYYLTKP